jgi:hypothetical protein
MGIHAKSIENGMELIRFIPLLVYGVHPSKGMSLR